VPHDPSRYDPTGARWEDRAAAIGQLHLEYGQEVDAEELYAVRRFADLQGIPRPAFYTWPCNAHIVRDARAAYGAKLVDEAGYVQAQRRRQARGVPYFAPRPRDLDSLRWAADGALKAARALSREGDPDESPAAPNPVLGAYKAPTGMDGFRVMFRDWRTAIFAWACILLAVANGAIMIYGAVK
jgi:hypothetical protein